MHAHSSLLSPLPQTLTLLSKDSKQLNPLPWLRLCHNTLTQARTQRLWPCHNTLTPASVQTLLNQDWQPNHKLQTMKALQVYVHCWTRTDNHTTNYRLWKHGKCMYTVKPGLTATPWTTDYEMSSASVCTLLNQDWQPHHELLTMKGAVQVYVHCWTRTDTQTTNYNERSTASVHTLLNQDCLRIFSMATGLSRSLMMRRKASSLKSTSDMSSRTSSPTSRTLQHPTTATLFITNSCMSSRTSLTCKPAQHYTTDPPPILLTVLKRKFALKYTINVTCKWLKLRLNVW